MFNAPLNAVLFASYGHALRTLDSAMGKTEAEKAGNKDLLKLTIAGGWSGLLQCAITVPMELIKVRQQVHHGTGPTPGAVQVARELVQAHGWRMGLFRGWWATVLRDIPSFAAYFIAYEKAKEMLGRLHVSLAGPPVIAPGATASQMRAAKEGTDQPWVLMAAGAAAGVATWTVTYPVDVVKTACQTLPKSTPYHEATATAVARRLYTQHGPMAFFRGIGPTVLRAIPSNAVTFLVYEWTMDLLGRPEDGEEQGQEQGKGDSNPFHGDATGATAGLAAGAASSSSSSSNGTASGSGEGSSLQAALPVPVTVAGLGQAQATGGAPRVQVGVGGSVEGRR